MASAERPGVWIEEDGVRPTAIEGVATGTAAFIGPAHTGPLHEPTLVGSWAEAAGKFGGPGGAGAGGVAAEVFLCSVRAFFAEGGNLAYVCRADGAGADAAEPGLGALEALEDIGLVACPAAALDGEDCEAVAALLVAHCERRRDRFAVLDTPRGADVEGALRARGAFDSSYAAMYYPWIWVRARGRGGRVLLPASGFAAGLMARSDAARGVHRAPAGEVVRSATRLGVQVSAAQQDALNPAGVNCFRSFPRRGVRLWGARTLSREPEWKYVNVRRLIIYLERSIERGTRWAVFEPNGPALWDAVRGTVESFLHGAWRDRMLLGSTPDDAFFVRADRSTMTQEDIDSGRLIVLVGVAPVRPAEFVIFRIGQWTRGRRP